MFLTLEHFLKDADFHDDMKAVLEKFNPNYLKCLEIRRRDIDRKDKEIVIAGKQQFVSC